MKRKKVVVLLTVLILLIVGSITVLYYEYYINPIMFAKQFLDNVYNCNFNNIEDKIDKQKKMVSQSFLIVCEKFNQFDDAIFHYKEEKIISELIDTNIYKKSVYKGIMDIFVEVNVVVSSGKREDEKQYNIVTLKIKVERTGMSKYLINYIEVLDFKSSEEMVS